MLLMSLCIITGAGAGIGKATAIELSKQSFFDGFAILGRNAEALAATVNEMLENNAALKIKTYPIWIFYLPWMRLSWILTTQKLRTTL